MSPELLVNVVAVVCGAIGSGAAVYAAIKSDLTRGIVTAELAMASAALAHSRLDIHLQQPKG